MENISKTCLNTARVCRFCLSQTGVMSSIFDNKYNNNLPSLPAKIMSFVRIQLSLDDGLPPVLCHRCLYLAEKAYDFKAQCEASDGMLREYLSVMQASLPQTPIKAEPREIQSLSENQHFLMNFSPSQNMPTISQTNGPLKRKRGRPRKEENLIFYSSPEHTNELVGAKPIDEVKIVDGIESLVTVVDPLSENLYNSDEENKRESMLPFGSEIRENDTARSLAIARAKAKKYMGVVFSTDENGVRTRRHLCKGCGKTFGHCSDLRKHVLVHTGERPFHCQLCTKTFSRSTNLNKHLKVHSGQKPFTCSKCFKSFGSKGDLQRHLVIHSGVKPFSCHQCHQSFSRKDKLTRHVKLHDNGTSTYGKPSAKPSQLFSFHEDCDEMVAEPGRDVHGDGDGDYDTATDLDNEAVMSACDVNGGAEELEEDVPSSSEEIAQSDFGDNAGDVESIVIDIDPFSMEDDAQDMSGSLEDVADATPDHWTVEESGLMCVFCQRVCSDETKMRIHLSNHMLGRPHKCQLCDKAFTRRRELLRHENVHTGLKPHKCPICTRAFARKDKLARHVKIHSDEKPVKKLYCEPCTVGFYKQDLYDAHMATHSDQLVSESGSSDGQTRPSGGESDEENQTNPLKQLTANPSITVTSVSKACFQ